MARAYEYSAYTRSRQVCERKISRGEFRDPAEVIEQALRLLEDCDAEERARIDPLIREGLGSLASEMTEADWDDITREGTAADKLSQSP